LGRRRAALFLCTVRNIYGIFALFIDFYEVSTMARRRSGSALRKVHRPSAVRGEGADGVPVPERLREAIETERDNLAKAESLLGCLAISMEYQPNSATGPYYPDVAEMARSLVRQSINALDSLALQRHLLRNRIKEEIELRIADLYDCMSLTAREEQTISIYGINPARNYH
jgi:hypothetical protein